MTLLDSSAVASGLAEIVRTKVQTASAPLNLADMAKGQRIPGASPSRKPRASSKPVAGAHSRIRRALHDTN